MSGTDLHYFKDGNWLGLPNKSYVDSAIVAGRGLVAVKHVEKTDTFSASLAGASFTTVTGLTINHAISNASNKVLLVAHLSGGWAANANNNFVMRLHADANVVSQGDADGNRLRVTAGELSMGAGTQAQLDATSLYSPPSTSSIEYSIRVGVYAASNLTLTVYVNRANGDTNAVDTSYRPVSSLTLLEVAV
jgi:hypothetical protein